MPKATLKFNDLLGEFMGLRKRIGLTVIICHSKKMQFKISEGKRCREQGPGETRHELPVVRSHRSHKDSAQSSQQQRATRPMDAAHPGSSLAQAFDPRWLTYSTRGAPTRLAALVAQPPAPPEVKPTPCGPRPPPSIVLLLQVALGA